MISQNPVFREEVDHRSSGLSRTAEEKRAREAWKTNSKPALANGRQHDYFRGNSIASQSSDKDHDTYAFFRAPGGILQFLLIEKMTFL